VTRIDIILLKGQSIMKGRSEVTERKQ